MWRVFGYLEITYAEVVDRYDLLINVVHLWLHTDFFDLALSGFAFESKKIKALLQTLDAGRQLILRHSLLSNWNVFLLINSMIIILQLANTITHI